MQRGSASTCPRLVDQHRSVLLVCRCLPQLVLKNPCPHFIPNVLLSPHHLPSYHTQYPICLHNNVCWHLTTGCPSSCPSPSVHRVMTPKLSAVPIPPHSATQQSIHPLSWCPISPPAWSWGGAWSNWDNRCARPRKLSYCKDAKITMMTAERSFNG